MKKIPYYCDTFKSKRPRWRGPDLAPSHELRALDFVHVGLGPTPVIL